MTDFMFDPSPATKLIDWNSPNVPCDFLPLGLSHFYHFFFLAIKIVYILEGLSSSSTNSLWRTSWWLPWQQPFPEHTQHRAASERFPRKGVTSPFHSPSHPPLSDPWKLPGPFKIDFSQIVNHTLAVWIARHPPKKSKPSFLQREAT